jgi:Co/Zn/Cd efflux system component/copper chaperone CopZ
MSTTALRYHVDGMDCASCARKVEAAACAVAGVEAAQVSTTTQILELAPGRADPAEVERRVLAAGYRLEPIDAETGATPAHASPTYRRALVAVVALNLGYGLVEMAGGFLSGSQALKADALDFVGDGLITGLGIVAIGWSLGWRARAALLQGVFLALLGLGVLGTTAWRAISGEPPEAGLMGVFGVIALAVNVGAAALLLPHRTGDANVRAVWLFSRNDAIGNAAVVAAAGLVAWTGTRWPDLAVAAAVAGLFLHSAWMIIRDARAELDAPAPA